MPLQLYFEFAKSSDIQKKLIDTYGDYKIYSVNGKKVRNLSANAEEFGSVETHPRFPKLIPENEIWIDNAVKPVEWSFMITDALTQLRYVKLGYSVDAAYDKGLAVEQKERQILSHIKFRGKRQSLPRAAYEKKYGILPDGTSVWIVDFDYVRDIFKTDAIEGAQPEVYNFVPQDEIWLESGLEKSEMPYILVHESVERILMREQKMKYDDAHELAAKLEFSLRQKNMLTKSESLSVDDDFVRHHIRY